MRRFGHFSVYLRERRKRTNRDKSNFGITLRFLPASPESVLLLLGVFHLFFSFSASAQNEEIAQHDFHGGIRLHQVSFEIPGAFLDSELVKGLHPKETIRLGAAILGDTASDVVKFHTSFETTSSGGENGAVPHEFHLVWNPGFTIRLLIEGDDD
jgi:hypothetical protein